MINDEITHLNELLDRLARLIAAGEWQTDLNPAQRNALSYIARANRFSRSPSHVADYLSTTRGTATQTLKALERKDMIERERSQDRRSVTFTLTRRGEEALRQDTDLIHALKTMPEQSRSDLSTSLQHLMHGILRERGGKTFGICRTCRHHRPKPSGAYCSLLDVTLQDWERSQICHEHLAP